MSLFNKNFSRWLVSKRKKGKEEYLNLWKEFENRETAEAKYAASVDRFIPFILNSRNKGGNWPKNKITVKRAIEKNSHMQEGSEVLWDMAQIMLEECSSQGYIDKE